MPEWLKPPTRYARIQCIMLYLQYISHKPCIYHMIVGVKFWQDFWVQMGGRHSGSVASANLPPGATVCRGVFGRPGRDRWSTGSYDPSWKGVLKHTMENHGKHWKSIGYPLVNKQTAIEHGHRNSGFTHWKWWFSIVFCMFTRGYHIIVIIYYHMIPRYWYYIWVQFTWIYHIYQEQCVKMWGKMCYYLEELAVNEKLLVKLLALWNVIDALSRVTRITISPSITKALAVVLVLHQVRLGSVPDWVWSTPGTSSKITFFSYGNNFGGVPTIYSTTQFAAKSFRLFS